MISSVNYLHIALNSITYDSRVLKETQSVMGLDDAGCLEIAGLRSEKDEEVTCLSKGRKIRRFDLKTRSGPKNLLFNVFKYAEFYYKVVKFYRRQPLKIVHAHDLEALPIAAKLASKTGARLIYDAHELQTETKSAKGLKKVLAYQVEKRLIGKADAMITVSPSIMEWYKVRYPDVSLYLVRNVPIKPRKLQQPIALKEKLGVPQNALLFIYLGGMGSGRGIHNILAAFKNDSVKHHVLFMGSGPLENDVIEASSTCAKIHHCPPVPPSEVLRNAAGADIGLSLIEDYCLNYRYCLPNKLFECLLAGLPVLASNLPDQANIVNSYQAGWVVDNSVVSIVERLKTLTVEEATQLRKHLPERIEDLSWEREAENIQYIYKKILFDG